MNNLTMIKANLDIVRAKIEEAAKRAGRPAGEVKLIAVSKTFGADRVKEAYDAGITDFGENRVKEAKEKIAELDIDVRWHLIGHLQTNKVSVAARIFDVIHSIDSVRLARLLDDHAGGLSKSLEILLQVNIGGEPQKSGVAPGDVVAAAKEIIMLENVNITGLMTIPPYSTDKEVTREYYRQLAEIRGKVNEELGENLLTELSMGMSDDYDVAILEGATYIRVGSALFGARDYS